MTRTIPRWLARAPIPVFQHGWGWVLGPRVVMLQHTGRTSGLPRRVVLEVLSRDGARIVVPSGYGARSQWFRNVRADPRVRVWTGRVRGAPAIARVLSPDEARAELEQYRTRHPWLTRVLGRALGVPDLTGDQPLTQDVADRLPLVELTPSPGGTEASRPGPAANG